MSFSPFETAAILIVLVTILGYLNYRFMGLPHTIGLTVMGALASLAVIAIDWILPLPLDEPSVHFCKASTFPRRS